MEFKTYTRRAGSGDLGREYEIKVTALLALRCAFLADTEALWLGANVDGVGDFDDVILCRKTNEGRQTACLLQLKHQENPKELTQADFLVANQKNNFLLSKYHASYLDLKIKLDSRDEASDVINFLRKCDEIDLVLYTNKLAGDSDILEVSVREHLKFLNTGCSGSIFKFKAVYDLGLEPNFLSHLVLFANQGHVNSLEGLIETEIQRFVKERAKIVSQNFIIFITTWYKLTNVGFTLTKLDVVNKLVELALDQHVVQFSREIIPTSSNPLMNVWHDICSTSLVTGIDFDDSILTFLKLYLAVEVKKHVQADGRKKWNDHLPKQAQTDFVHNFLNPNLKVSKKDDQMTVFDTYQHLWLCKKLPLLIQVQTEEDYVKVVHTLEATTCNLHVLILKATEWNPQNVTSSLADLQLDQQNSVLDLEVQLQARPPLKLHDLLEPSTFHHVTCKDIIFALTSSLNVGGSYEGLPDQFIEQKLSKIYLNHKVLANVPDEIFLIKNLDKAPPNNLSNVLNFDPSIDMEAFGLNKKSAHKLIYFNDCYLEWRKTAGSIRLIRDYQAEHIYDHLNLDLQGFKVLVPTKPWSSLKCHQEQFRQVQVISANAGMGKSVLMNSIASTTPTDIWVLKVNLSDYEDCYVDLHDLPVLEQLKLLNSRVLEKTNCQNLKLGQAVFERFLNQKKVLILLDGFDEITVLFKNEITSMAKKFYKDGWPIWITTRPVMKTHLEDAFNTFSFTLRPFTLKDQQTYLAKYFTSILDPGPKRDLLVAFIDELLDSSRSNFRDTDFQFTGIPLQTKFLADVFTADYRQCIATSTIAFNRNFDLLYLYEEFSKNKTEILCDKYGKDAKRTRILFKKYQQLYAVLSAIPRAYLKNFDLENILAKYSEDKDEEMQFLQREGVLILNQYLGAQSKYKFNVTFVHLTYAEFLASQWFVENIYNEEPSLNKTIKSVYEWRFTDHSNPFFFKMVDNILAKGCTNHVAIIKGRFDQIVSSSSGTVLDKAGRTGLHLLALYGFQHPKQRKPAEKIQDDLIDYVDLMSDDDVTVKDKILSYNPFEYALKNMTLAIANRICERCFPSSSLEIGTFEHYVYLDYCGLQNYLALYKTLLPHYGGRSILLEIEKKELTVAQMQRGTLKTNLEMVNELGVNQVLELFKFPAQSDHSYSDPRFAVSFGDVANVEFLLSQGLDVKETDCDGNTLLYYSTVFRKFQTLQLLLAQGSEVNKPCKQGNTALHIAAKKGYEDFVLELLKKDAEINQLNDKNQTPISLALLWNKLEVVALLEGNGAVFNVEDLDGSSLLHYAAVTGNTDFILKYLSAYPISVNKQNKKGETPLLLATKNRKLEAVQLLLLNGASSNKEADNGYTPLHFAAEEGFSAIAVEILCNNCDINKVDKIGQTALVVALKANQKEIAELLVGNGADCNLRDDEGYMPLHLAIKVGWSHLAVLMMAQGAFVDKVARSNSTPLHVAVENCDSVITTILLECDIDFNAKDDQANTALHYAAEFGQTDIVESLLARGAEIDALNKLKHTPLQSAMFTGRIETAEFLLSQGANWSTKNVCDSTSLHFASQFGQTGLMLCFLTAGANPNSRNVDEDSPLHLAARYEHLGAVEILLAHGVVLHEKNCNGKTPLHLIVENRVYGMFEERKYPDCIKIVKLLIENGFDVDATDNYGNTALHYVCVLKNKPLPLSEEATKDIMDNFYLPVASMLLKTKLNATIKNIEGKTALDLAVRAGYANLVELLEQYSCKFQCSVVT